MDLNRFPPHKSSHFWIAMSFVVKFTLQVNANHHCILSDFSYHPHFFLTIWLPNSISYCLLSHFLYSRHLYFVLPSSTMNYMEMSHKNYLCRSILLRSLISFQSLCYEYFLSTCFRNKSYNRAGLKKKIDLLTISQNSQLMQVGK